MRGLVFLIGALFCVQAWAHPVIVVGVIDGDTVDVLTPEKQQFRCRLYGIDAPEKSQAFGQASKRSLSDLIYRQSLDVDQMSRDRYGRSICRLTLNGLDVSHEQVSRGMAWVYRKYTHAAALYRAEADAQAQRLGLWVDNTPTPPWEYRHPH